MFLISLTPNIMENLKAMRINDENAFIKHVERVFDVSIETSYESDIDFRTEFEDKETVKSIRKQLDKGNYWAWCSVVVSVEINGLATETNLGGCSYKSEADFKSGGYYADMLIECLSELESGANAILEAFN